MQVANARSVTAICHKSWGVPVQAASFLQFLPFPLMDSPGGQGRHFDAIYSQTAL